jgi:hypothetical protein
MNRLLQLVLFALAAFSACHKPEAAAATEPGGKKPELIALPPVKVVTAEVTHQKMPRFLTLTGSVLADKQSPKWRPTSPAASPPPTSSAACR